MTAGSVAQLYTKDENDGMQRGCVCGGAWQSRGIPFYDRRAGMLIDGMPAVGFEMAGAPQWWVSGARLRCVRVSGACLRFVVVGQHGFVVSVHYVQRNWSHP